MRCINCESIDSIRFANNNLWFYTPTRDIYSKLSKVCKQKSLRINPIEGHNLYVCIDDSELESFVTDMMSALSRRELKNIKVLPTAANAIQPPDVALLMTADVFVHRIKDEWIINSIEKRAFQTWYQPIVHASDTENVFAAEALFRLKDYKGAIVPSNYVFDVADAADIMFSVDLAARANAVSQAASHGWNKKLFINFNPSSIYDPSSCPEKTASNVSAMGLQTSDIVFEITEAERIADIQHIKEILTVYRDAGFKIALDDIGSGWSGLNIMHSFRPDYIKIDMDLIRNIDQDVFKRCIVEHLISIAKEQNICVVAEGIETIEEQDILYHVQAVFLQGFLYAKPAPIDTIHIH